MNHEAGVLDDEAVPYAGLSPELVVDAVEAAGFRCDGRQLALNSYENRVYQVGIEDDRPVVVKFYRPGRWSDAAILEEHGFALELAEAEIPVVAPLDTGAGTLMRYGGYRYAVFARVSLLFFLIFFLNFWTAARFLKKNCFSRRWVDWCTMRSRAMDG